MKRFGQLIRKIGMFCIWAAVFFFGKFLVGIFILAQTSEGIGIIGGADGPTAVFLTGALWKRPVFHLLLLGVGIAAMIYGKKLIKESEDDSDNNNNF